MEEVGHGRPGETRRPFFVYGTLRRGEGNYRRLKGRTEAEHPATLPNHALYGVGLPYVIDAEGAAVVGELMFIRARHYDEVLADLDRLEGYRPGGRRCHYERVCRRVHYVDALGLERTVAAWVYQAGPVVRAQLAESNPVPGGDWLAAGERQGLRRVG